MSTITPPPAVRNLPSRRTSERAGAKVASATRRVSQPDRKIEVLAARHLEGNPHFNGHWRTIEFHFDGDRLTLGGCLPSFYMKQLAQEAVRSLANSMQIEIVNEIVVVDFVGEVRSNDDTRDGKLPNSFL